MKNDGGPAFARSCFDNGEWSNESQPGMSLRDYFAGQALVGHMLAADKQQVSIQMQTYARASYAVADAMLEARGQ